MSLTRKISLGTRSKSAKIQLYVQNVSVAFGDGKIVTESMCLPLTRGISFSMDIEDPKGSSAEAFLVKLNFTNTTSDDKIVYFRIAIDKNVVRKYVGRKYILSQQMDLYRRVTVNAHHRVQFGSWRIDKRMHVSDDSFRVQIRLEEALENRTIYTGLLFPIDRVFNCCKTILTNLMLKITKARSKLSSIEDTNSEEMLKLLTALSTNDETKDVKFVIGKQTLMAHKAIITTRSKVFRAMLFHDTKEKADGVIEIKDTNFEVFKSFVKYLYTNQIEIGGKCYNDAMDSIVKLIYPNQQLEVEKMCEELLFLADKYDVQCLRSKCQRIVVGQFLTVKTAIDYLIKADIAGFEILKARALEVITMEWSVVRKSEELKSLKDYPDLLDEICEKYLVAHQE